MIRRVLKAGGIFGAGFLSGMVYSAAAEQHLRENQPSSLMENEVEMRVSEDWLDNTVKFIHTHVDAHKDQMEDRKVEEFYELSNFLSKQMFRVSTPESDGTTVITLNGRHRLMILEALLHGPQYRDGE